MCNRLLVIIRFTSIFVVASEKMRIPGFRIAHAYCRDLSKGFFGEFQLCATITNRDKPRGENMDRCGDNYCRDSVELEHKKGNLVRCAGGGPDQCEVMYHPSCIAPGAECVGNLVTSWTDPGTRPEKPLTCLPRSPYIKNSQVTIQFYFEKHKA